METNQARAHEKPRFAAFVAAMIFLVTAGAGFRTLAHYLDRAPTCAPIPPGTLRELPLRIGGWAGREQALDESIVRATDVDDYVSRLYVRESDNQGVGLWVAFGVRARDLMPHRPEVCYPGAGWTLLDQHTTVLQAKNGATLRARVLTFAPGGLDPRHLTVLNYYIVDGETSEDVSLLRSKAWRGQASIGYMAQVQITCRTDPTRAIVLPANVVREFAVETFGPIRDLLRESVGPGIAADNRGKS